MNEATKTFAFLGAALAVVALAFVSRPSLVEFDATKQVGKPLQVFDQDQAKRLKVVKFNEETATLREFEVAEEEGLWRIPSKGGYPADAQKQMGEAVNGVADREILSVESSSAADHAKYGVVDPNSPKLEAGQTGVGTRITLASDGGDPLVDLIVGKKVKDSENQYYVRKPAQDVVYVTDIQPSDFSTKFEDWIEPDLLKLNAFDIQNVTLNDYTASAELVMAGGSIRPRLNWDRRDKISLEYDEEKGNWKSKNLETFDKVEDTYKPFTLGENEELNEEKLQELKSALDDLRIVDVDRKPAGLSANLKTGEDFIKDEQGLQSLITKGFIPASQQSGEFEILSSEGEAIATLKNGVEYVLRFGRLRLSNNAEQAAAAAAPGADPAAEAKKDEEGVDRYLFVLARFNEGAVKKPELEELPALPETKEAEPSAEEPAAEEGSDAAAEEKPAEESAEGEADKPAEGEDAKDEATAEADTEADAEQPTDEKAAEEAADGEPADSEAADGETEDSAKPAEESDAELAKVIADRKRIEAENQRKLDEYKGTLEKGKKQVEDLNSRFGDWYYVISDEVYKKIHLGKKEIIKEKEKPAEEKADEPKEPASNLGAPGTSIPGLPDLPEAE